MQPSKRSITVALGVVAAAPAAAALGACGADTRAPVSEPGSTELRFKDPPRAERKPDSGTDRKPSVRWRRSVAVGSPSAGRLIRGVQLPARGPFFSTWDPNLHRSPNRGWRRWGTARLVQRLLIVAREYRSAHPGAPPLLVGDLTRPHGGDFGRSFGYVWHASHQNGLDV